MHKWICDSGANLNMGTVKQVGGRTRLGRIAATPLAIALTMLLSGCLTGQETAALPAGSLVASISSDIRSTQPGVNRDANTDTVMAHVLEGLVAYGEHGRPQPMLADRIQVSPDGTTYRFTLRPGVRFHNGALLTAGEVVWTWQRYLDPKTGWVCLRDFDGSNGSDGSKILSVTAENPLTAVFRLSRPQPLFLAQMASVQCGQSAILHPASVKADGSWHAPIATGPYRLERWVRGEYIDLAAFPEYARRPEKRDGLGGGKIAYAPIVRWMVIRDGSARLAALVKGQIDVMPETTSAELRQVARYPQLRLATAPGAVVNALLIRPTTPYLADARIRRALALSIDRRELATLATVGTGSPNASMVPANSPHHRGLHRTALNPNLAEARKLLTEAGYEGEPIELMTNRRYSDMFDQALLVQAMARRVGINLQIKVTEWATQLDAYGSGDFQLMSFSYSARAEPTLTYASIIGDGHKNARKQWGSPAAISLLAEAGRADDDDERQRIFDDLHKLMLQEVPLVALFNPADNNAIRADLEGFRSWSIGRARLWGVRRKSGGRA